MVPGRNGSTDDPDAGTVLAALNDERCRRLIASLDRPLTATELADRCGIPQSTVYRKLELLAEAGLVAGRVHFGRGSPHIRRYSLDFETVTVSLRRDRTLTVAVEKPSTGPDEQLQALWTAVREQR
ncbi:ArsR/SmtB family transcription factor [Halobacteriaceae archaeon GCM10025711]